MTRAELLSRVLTHAVELDAATGLALCLEHPVSRDRAWSLGLAAFSAFLLLDHAHAAELAERALREADADDDESTLLARAARGLAAAGWSPGLRAWTDIAPGLTPTGDPLADAAAELDRLDAGAPADFVRYLTGEAALSCGRLSLCAEVFDGAPEPALFLPRHGRAHPFGTIMRISRVRALAFRARIDEARELLASVVTDGLPTICEHLTLGTRSLVGGNAAERTEVRALADRVETARPVPLDYLSVGGHLLVAFGLVAVGEVRRSARFMLVAGGGADLSGLAIVDRGLGWEMLTSAAVLEGDLDAAEAWRERAEPLIDSPIAGSTVARLISRVELLRGDAAAAVDWADRAIAAALAEGRIVEAAEGEIVRSRAAIASSQAGSASLRLDAMVGDADETGHTAARRAAARELRLVGRRLRPAAGSNWEGLSVRERDVAVMVAEGLTNREIGLELHLSEHTVRAHVSRVLAAFGAASRFAVAAQLAELFPPEPGPPPAPLTPRQWAVAERIAKGLGNAEIGRELELSVKTVEKHIGEILRRWNTSTRVGIARRVRTAAE